MFTKGLHNMLNIGFTFRMNKEMRKRLRDAAKKTGIKESHLIREFIGNGLDSLKVA